MGLGYHACMSQLDLGAGDGALLGALGLTSFLAATVLPGGSEVAFVALLRARPALASEAVVVATVGNTLGGLTSVGLGRLLPVAPQGAGLERVRRFGPSALLFAWLPLVGDALCVAAGWLRLPWLASTAWMAAGKGARYLALAWGLS